LFVDKVGGVEKPTEIRIVEGGTNLFRALYQAPQNKGEGERISKEATRAIKQQQRRGKEKLWKEKKKGMVKKSWFKRGGGWGNSCDS